jgi:hypothetical protein
MTLTFALPDEKTLRQTCQLDFVTNPHANLCLKHNHADGLFSAGPAAKPRLAFSDSPAFCAWTDEENSPAWPCFKPIGQANLNTGEKWSLSI